MSAPEAEIRELGRADLDALLGAYELLHELDEPLPARDQVVSLWERICSDPALVYVGAFVGGELAATCTVAIVPNLTRGARPYGLIENVVTDPRHRRQGLGSAIIQNVLDRCWKAGCYKVMLMSGAANDQAHEFYVSNGFDKQAKQAFIIRQ